MGASFYMGGGKTGMARRLAWDEPSLTLTCSPAQKQTERCHPSETRPLTVREYARIQCFPDDWEFAGSVTSQYKQIGNAVPVNLGYHIGLTIRKILQRPLTGAEQPPNFTAARDGQETIQFD
jgi:DNA (cytosine-5)-methyltransferase 1